MNLFQTLLHYVLLTSKEKKIDESHGLGHAMDVLVNSNQIYTKEVERYPEIKPLEPVIYICAMLHDMCDKKYMDETKAIEEIEDILYEPTTERKNKPDYGIEISGTQDIVPFYTYKQPRFGLNDEDIIMIKTIIGTMSYSKVKEHGFPDLGKYTMAYHIVREADLLAAYDFDRAMLFHMHHTGKNALEAFDNSYDLFQKRVFQHENDKLFTTLHAKEQHLILMKQSQIRIKSWQNLLKKT